MSLAFWLAPNRLLAFVTRTIMVLYWATIAYLHIQRRKMFAFFTPDLPVVRVVGGPLSANILLGAGAGAAAIAFTLPRPQQRWALLPLCFFFLGPLFVFFPYGSDAQGIIERFGIFAYFWLFAAREVKARQRQAALLPSSIHLLLSTITTMQPSNSSPFQAIINVLAAAIMPFVPSGAAVLLAYASAPQLLALPDPSNILMLQTWMKIACTIAVLFDLDLPV